MDEVLIHRTYISLHFSLTVGSQSFLFSRECVIITERKRAAAVQYILYQALHHNDTHCQF